MPQFLYKAKDQKGALIQGSMDADGRGAVVSRLQQMGYFPIAVDAAVRSGGKVVMAKPGATSQPQAGTRGAGSFRLFRRGIRSADLAEFNRQLADLIGSGVPLVKALAILAKQTLNEELKQVVDGVLADVQGGATFADALAKYPKLFPKLYIAMIKSGEAGGMLDQVLSRLAEFSEQEESLKGRIKSALAYPVVMTLACGGAVFVMFAYVIPRITSTFRQLGQSLPWLTQVLIAISDFVALWWWAILLAVVGLVAAAWQFVSTAEGRAIWHRVQLRIPVFGVLVQKREVARFSRTLGSLLRNGVSILTSLEIVREVAENTLIRKEIDRVMDEITQGSGVAAPLRQSTVFPSVAVNMIAIGEETGRLPDVLLRIGDSYEADVDRQVKTLTSLIEPVIIVAMGLVVAFIVIAMLLPIFSLDPSAGSGGGV